LKNLKENSNLEEKEFILDWFNLFPYKITNKDLERILTHNIDKRIKLNGKRISIKESSS